MIDERKMSYTNLNIILIPNKKYKCLKFKNVDGLPMRNRYSVYHIFMYKYKQIVLDASTLHTVAIYSFYLENV